MHGSGILKKGDETYIGEWEEDKLVTLYKDQEDDGGNRSMIVRQVMDGIDNINTYEEAGLW